MKVPTLEDDSVSIVLLGAFNPKIFHPMWFAAHGLIRQSDAESANIEVVHPEYAAFATESFRFSVSTDRFSVESAGSGFREMMRDLVTGTFSLLGHTPLRTLGLNRIFHYRMESEDEWHTVGHKLTPKAVWRDTLKNPGMEDLRIRAVRPDEHQGFIRVIVQPSMKVKPGVYVQVNDHYEVEAQEAAGAERIMDILKNIWQVSLARAERVTHTMFANL